LVRQSSERGGGGDQGGGRRRQGQIAGRSGSCESIASNGNRVICGDRNGSQHMSAAVGSPLVCVGLIAGSLGAVAAAVIRSMRD
jgi:hypothetical protein